MDKVDLEKGNEKRKGTKIGKKVIFLIAFLLCVCASFIVYTMLNTKISLENAELHIEGVLITAPYSALVQDIPVQTGNDVIKNTLLLEFDTTLIRQALATAENNLNLISLGQTPDNTFVSPETELLIKSQREIVARDKFNEDQARKEHEYWANTQARFLFELRKPDLSEAQRLEYVNSEANAKLMKENASAKFEASSYMRAESEKKLQILRDSQKNPKISENLQPNTQRVAWEQRYKEAAKALEKAKIYAPFDAFIVDILCVAGETVQINQPLFRLAPQNTENYLIIAYASTTDAKKIHQGQKAHFHGNNIELDALVSEISINKGEAQITFIPTTLPDKAMQDKGSITIEFN